MKKLLIASVSLLALSAGTAFAQTPNPQPTGFSRTFRNSVLSKEFKATTGTSGR